MNTSKARYDRKVKVTRILVGDYLVLMALSRKTGKSMADTLHNILTRLGPAEPKGEPARIPVSDFRVTAPVSLRLKPQPAIATNGNKAVAFRIKAKGVKYD